jgi:coproporphyrinogen III oxidase
MDLEKKRKQSVEWFVKLQNDICAEFEKLEKEFAKVNDVEAGKFVKTDWDREGGGGGQMRVMKGGLFEKVGVNFSQVHGEFSPEMRKEIPGAEENPEFWASGVSLVAHMHSPLVPAIHFNTRFINTSKQWFGGGTDLNPAVEFIADTEEFHVALKEGCDKFGADSYEKYKKWCDEYFYIKHRKQARGVGGIFFDYLDSGDFSNDFDFTKEVGKVFLDIYPKLVRRNMFKEFSDLEKEIQLRKRGLYTEFNLIYDRGTKFGLMTDGNVDAILMSLPPVAKWD